MMEMIKNLSNSEMQMIILSIWALLTIYYVNKGGRNNGIFKIVVQSGFRLIFIGAVTASLIVKFKAPELQSFTDAAMNFVLILSSAIGASYIAHANMSLRDNPNVSSKPEQLFEDSMQKDKK